MQMSLYILVFSRWVIYFGVILRISHIIYSLEIWGSSIEILSTGDKGIYKDHRNYNGIFKHFLI